MCGQSTRKADSGKDVHDEYFPQVVVIAAHVPGNQQERAHADSARKKSCESQWWNQCGTDQESSQKTEQDGSMSQKNRKVWIDNGYSVETEKMSPSACP